MKKILYNYTVAAVALLTVASCSPSLDEFQPVQTSTADFSKFIAVGNTHTAGYADGGLQRDGQLVAFPNLIAAQMQHVGGGSFLSPLFGEDQANGSGRIILTGFDAHGVPQTREETENLAHRGTNLLGATLFTRYEGEEYNNYGVPGMTLPMSLLPGFATATFANPYFERMVIRRVVNLATYSNFTSGRDHTFFLSWLGVDDALGNAMNGAVDGGLTQPNTRLTQQSEFNGIYNRVIDSLVINNQHGVIATIPDVTLLPFFNTVTYAEIRAGIARSPLGALVASRPLFIQTSTGTRPATPDDLFVLPVGQLPIGQPIDRQLGLDARNPIPRNMVLEPGERQQIRNRINQFNTIIRATAAAHNLALVDMYEFVQQLSTGRHVQNGIPLNTNYIEGNMFSLDGLHFTPLGNAVVANLFIDAINAHYHSSIPRINISQYPGVRMAN